MVDAGGSLTMDLHTPKAWGKPSPRNSPPVAEGTGKTSEQGKPEVPRRSYPQKEPSTKWQTRESEGQNAIFSLLHWDNSKVFSTLDPRVPS